jgi:hypothetical protein
MALCEHGWIGCCESRDNTRFASDTRSMAHCWPKVRLPLPTRRPGTGPSTGSIASSHSRRFGAGRFVKALSPRAIRVGVVRLDVEEQSPCLGKQLVLRRPVRVSTGRVARRDPTICWSGSTSQNRSRHLRAQASGRVGIPLPASARDAESTSTCSCLLPRSLRPRHSA